MGQVNGINSEWQPAAAVMRKWIGQGKQISTAEAAWDGRVSDDSIGNYATARTVPDAMFLRRMADAYAETHPQFVLDLLNAIFQGTDFRVIDVRQYDAAAADANGDGRVDGRDTQVMEARTLGEVSKLIQAHSDAMKDGQLSPEEAMDQLRQVDELEKHIGVLRAGLHQQTKRFGR